MFREPKSGWRRVTARPRRTKADWANELADLMRTRNAKPQRGPRPSMRNNAV
ncbi:hypothetical protein KIH39_04540 [Telmatocola sphagniphila]|uniref:Uncharacterized protein n=1 Tax=Telmatocola sphagniphila TaxID=1123043 RepID=A0A8E6EZ88_9BACT|nr:hypothetical protein [Telmatocola sphagniphila]QVL33191.1 hypothetical protein KIH39_04540 [Telmatocola sphagniphila]